MFVACQDIDFPSFIVYFEQRQQCELQNECWKLQGQQSVLTFTIYHDDEISAGYRSVSQWYDLGTHTTICSQGNVTEYSSSVTSQLKMRQRWLHHSRYVLPSHSISGNPQYWSDWPVSSICTTVRLGQKLRIHKWRFSYIRYLKPHVKRGNFVFFGLFH